MRPFRSLAISLLLVTVALLAVQPAVVHGAPPAGGPVVHIVRWGENLTQIAARYGVSVYDIAQANALADLNRIYVGQRLVIPLPPGPVPVPSGDTVQHVVQVGDTLSALAVRYRSTINAIVQTNRLMNPSYIYVGQVLAIPTQGTGLPATGVYYAVRAGDTLAGIAYRHGVSYWSIVQANNLRYASVIHVGQTLFIPGVVGPVVGPTATPVPQTDAVEGWAGKVVSNPAGSEYDDYFEDSNGDRYGIASTDDTVQQQIAAKRDTDQVVYVWGTLLHDVPDVNGVQISVTHIGESATASVDWLGKIVAFAPGAQYDDYFERDNGDRYGITSNDAAINALIADLRILGSTVRVVGEMTTNVPDAYGKQIVVTKIEIKAPASGTPTATWQTPACTPPEPAPQTATAYPPCTAPSSSGIPAGAVPLPSPFPPKPLHMDSPEYGMTINVWGTGDCNTDRDLRLVKEAEFTWVRQVFRWRDIETKNDVFDWSEADRVVAMVAKYELDLAIAVAYQPEWAGGGYPLNGPPRNMADFADFMGALGKRYKGLVRAYEIWPGPNVSENWGGQSPDPVRYAEMLIVGYWYVKNEDPYAMIITGGLVQTAKHDYSSKPPIDFFREMYEGTDANLASDVWGVEALGFRAAPENTPEELAHPDMNNSFPATAEQNMTWGFRSVELLQDYARERPIKKQWVITKLGWTTDPNERSWTHWAAVSEEVKADHLRRAYRWAKEQWSDWVGVMFVPLTDQRLTTSDEDYWWSVVEPGGCPRKSYYVLKDMSK